MEASQAWQKATEAVSKYYFPDIGKADPPSMGAAVDIILGAG